MASDSRTWSKLTEHYVNNSGREITATFDVYVNWPAIRGMARRAVSSKGKQSRDGALRVVVTAMKRATK